MEDAIVMGLLELIGCTRSWWPINIKVPLERFQGANYFGRWLIQACLSTMELERGTFSFGSRVTLIQACLSTIELERGIFFFGSSRRRYI